MDETNLKIHKIDYLQKIFSEIFNNFEYLKRQPNKIIKVY